MGKRTKQKGLRKTAKNKPAEITVRRSSGRKEIFDTDRLASTVGRSGVPFILAHDVAKTLTRKIRAEARGRKRKTVTAMLMRSYVAEELAKRNHKSESAYRGGKSGSATRGEARKSVNKYVGKIRASKHSSYIADSDSIIHDKSKRRTSVR